MVRRRRHPAGMVVTAMRCDGSHLQMSRRTRHGEPSRKGGGSPCSGRHLKRSYLTFTEALRVRMLLLLLALRPLLELAVERRRPMLP